MKPTLTERIDAILPQTQCTQCSYPDCKSYASAIAEGQADINQCPPGDTAGILKLARLLGVAPKPLNTTHGHPKPKAVALIDEAICIGCTFCIQVCPVDAIVGAAKQMHVVITAACTSCELCIAPCPMDCIQMIPVTKRVSYETREASIANAEREQDATDLARKRHQFKLRRLEHEQYEQKKRHTQKIHTNQYNFNCLSTNYHKKAAIQSAQLRAAAVRKAANSNQGTVVVER